MPDPDPKAQSLVEEGLALYSEGRLDQALTKWDAALALDPSVPRAAEYSQYVRENRAALDSTFGDQSFGVEQSSGEQSAGEQSAGVDQGTGSSTSDALGHEELGPGLGFDIDISTDGAGDSSESAGEPESAGGVGLDFTPAGADELALPPLDDSVPAPEDLTPRVNMRSIEGIVKPGAAEAEPEDWTQRVDLDDYQGNIDRSSRESQSSHAPLRVVSGETGRAPRPSGDDFEPAELTPVGIKLPEPSRLVGSGGLVAEGELGLTPTPTAESFEGTGDSFEAVAAAADHGPVDSAAIDAELAQGQATPASLRTGERSAPEVGGVDLEMPVGFAPAESTPSRLSRESGRLDLRPEKALSENDFELPGPTAKRSSQDALAALELPPPQPQARGAGLTLDGLGQGYAGGLGESSPSSPEPASGKPGGTEVQSMLVGAQQLFDQGTFEGSLLLCERVLDVSPDHPRATELRGRNEEALLGQYEAKLGDLEAVPVVQVPQHEIVWHKLDHRAGFLISRIDGMFTFSEILDVSGMGRFETCRILSQLLDQGVIGPSAK